MNPCLTLVCEADSGRWIIYDGDGPAPFEPECKELWGRDRRPDEDTGEHSWPADMRAEYERLLGRGEFVDVPLLEDRSEPNLVELISDPDGCAWDQKCAHGHRVEQHAVYCHNDGWLYAPRKCRRGEWFADVYGGDPDKYAHERCPGFLRNPLFSEATKP